MKSMLMGALLLPLTVFSQSNLSGTWRLKDSKLNKGENFVDAIPLSMNIHHDPGVIKLIMTNSLGDRDTVAEESIVYGPNVVNETTTKKGRKKLVSFNYNGENHSWLKTSKVFVKDDTGQLRLSDNLNFFLSEDLTLLTVVREYEFRGDSAKEASNFIAEGIFEKITPEQLAIESARGKGVIFAEGLTWEQIKKKAKQENKYIFIDCYATWCGPCKVMDKSVYPLNMVGDAMNDDFISVKVQMDSTKNDAASVKLLYPLARHLRNEYGITALPTYLFFSPKGEPLHKAIGKLDAKKFIEVVTASKDPGKQLYTLLRKAKQKQLPWNEYPNAAKKLRGELGEKELAKEIAAVYIREYLNRISENELLTKVNLDFVGEYYSVVRSSDKIFKHCLTRPKIVDSIKEYEGGGWAEFIVSRTINREEIEPFLKRALKKDEEPNWTKLEQELSKQYDNNLAITYVLDERMAWYQKNKDWISYFKYLRPHLARRDLAKINLDHLHHCAWYVFKYSTDTTLMREALEWTEIVIKRTAEWLLAMPLDTKACLLYKIGKKEEGITLMKKISQAHPDQSYAYIPRINSMVNGEDIWLTF